MAGRVTPYTGNQSMKRIWDSSTVGGLGGGGGVGQLFQAKPFFFLNYKHIRENNLVQT